MIGELWKTIEKTTGSNFKFVINPSGVSREIIVLHQNGDLTLNGKFYPLGSQDQETVKDFIACLKEFNESAGLKQRS